MSYRLNPTEEAIAREAGVLAERALAPHAVDVDERARFPEEALEVLGKEGFLGLTVPQSHGGMGQGLGASVAVLDQLAQRCPSTAMVYLMHLCAVSCYAAAPDVAGDQLRAAAQGKHLGTLAWSESGSRSHFWAPISEAVKDNSGLKVSADKSWVTSAGRADGYVVSTRSPGATTPTDTMLLLVHRSDPGLAVAGEWKGLGLRGNASAPMTLDQVDVSNGRELAPAGTGFDTMLGVVLPVFQLGNSAVAVGIAEAATASTASHLTNGRLEHMGTNLASLPNLRARLAQMRIETDRARAHLSDALHAATTGADNALLMILESKAAASESALGVTDLGMRACGGAAFSKHVGVERQFRDARALGVMAPTTDVLHDFIGRALTGMDLFA